MICTSSPLISKAGAILSSSETNGARAPTCPWAWTCAGAGALCAEYRLRCARTGRRAARGRMRGATRRALRANMSSFASSNGRQLKAARKQATKKRVIRLVAMPVQKSPGAPIPKLRIGISHAGPIPLARPPFKVELGRLIINARQLRTSDSRLPNPTIAREGNPHETIPPTCLPLGERCGTSAP